LSRRIVDPKTQSDLLTALFEVGPGSVDDALVCFNEDTGDLVKRPLEEKREFVLPNKKKIAANDLASLLTTGRQPISSVTSLQKSNQSRSTLRKT
jgi:hypothetical protein